MARCGFDADGSSEVEELKERPETVMAHIGNGAAAEIVPAAEIGVSVVGMVRTIQGGAEPELPIKAGGDGRGFGGEQGELGPHGTHGPIVDFAERSDGAILDQV